MPWSTPFDPPIRLRGGGKLTTLQHAADYIMTLPEDVQQQERWQIAVENLINAAETGGGWADVCPDRGNAGAEWGWKRAVSAISIAATASVAIATIRSARSAEIAPVAQARQSAL
jgi:hypothetical protein